ncbi:MAG TPA: MFS transporter [Iamia sp.]
MLVYAFAVVSPRIVADTGWSEPVVAGAFSVAFLVSGLAAPAVTGLLERHGPRVVLSMGSIGGALGLLAFAGSHHLVVLYGAWVLIGLAMAASLYEPAMAVVVLLDPSRRQRSVATITLAGGLASTLFAPLTSVLVGALGWRLALVALAVAGCGTTLALHATLRLARAVTASSFARDLPSLLDSHPIRRLRVALLVEQVAATGTTTHIVGLLVARGMTLAMASTVLGVMGLGKVAGRLLLLSPVGRRTPGHLAVWCSAAQGVGLAVPLLTVRIPLLLVAVVVAAAGSGASTVLRPLLVAEGVGVDHFAAVSASVQRSAAPARALAPFALGAGVAVLGWTATWLLFLVAFGIAADRYCRLAAVAPLTPPRREGRNVRPAGTAAV